MPDVQWPSCKTAVAAPWYEECFRSALRRIAVVVNSSPGSGLCQGVRLDCADDAIGKVFQQKKWDGRLIQFNLIKEDKHTLDDEYRAEYFFYCDVDFPQRDGVRVAKFLVPAPFLNWGYKRLYQPVGTAVELEVAQFDGSFNSDAFIRHCAANYLVKNFWHNFVHRVIQGITTHNYHEFVGPAREDSDFEADNLANVLLVHSYGLPILTRGSIGEKTSKSIDALFRRNRCNLIFQERAKHRGKDRASMSHEERWEELEWRFCRGVANAVSMELISHGLATASLRVFLSGEVRSNVYGGDVPRTWRSGTVVVEVSGRRFSTPCPPYIPDDELRSDVLKRKVAPEREGAMRATRTKREKEIATRVLTDYRQLLRQDDELRESVAQAMNSVAKRARVLGFELRKRARK